MADEMQFEDCVLRVNKTYAAKFKKQKENAELDRLKQKYGQEALEKDEEEDSEATSESEDDDAKELNAETEKDFLKTLAMIKTKDPQIYKKDTKFYSDELSTKNLSKNPVKPVYLKDYEREQLLSKGSKAFDSSEDEDATDEARRSSTYVEEQEELKKSFRDAVSAIDDDKEAFLSKREKSDHEMEIEAKHYSEWLKKKNFTAKDKSDLEPLLKLWSDPNLDDDEKFLRNFILQKQYVDHDSNVLPTYDEVVEDFDQEEGELEQQEEFERKYNFRFEEPESAQLKSYPRDIAGSLRRKDCKRKDKRQERNERKLKEKDEKRQELKRLKNLKKKEIMEKLEKLKEVTGNPNVGFNAEDIDGDFDPEKYDKAMQNAFNDEYYNEEECEKPEFNDDDWEDCEDENWDEWNGQVEDEEPHCEDPNFIMDADYELNSRQSHAEENKKRKSTFSEVLHSTKPNFDPNEKTFEEYFDEYYKLDYEDIIGDMPCRFKYREVEPNDFGLTVDEILTCDDKELNQWASLKKAIQFRTREEEKKDLKRFRRKAKNMGKKKMILKSLVEQRDEETESKGASREGKDKAGRPISERRLEKLLRNVKGDAKWRWKGKGAISAKDRRELNTKRRLLRHFRGAKADKVTHLSSSRLSSYGVGKRKKRD